MAPPFPGAFAFALFGKLTQLRVSMGFEQSNAETRNNAAMSTPPFSAAEGRPECTNFTAARGGTMPKIRR